MSRPWRNREVLLLGHSQMEGMAPFFIDKLRQSRVRTIHQHIERGALQDLGVLATEVGDEDEGGEEAVGD